MSRQSLRGMMITIMSTTLLTVVVVLFFLIVIISTRLSGFSRIGFRLFIPLNMFFFLFWIFFVPKAGLRWKHSLLWLSYPVAYFAYIMVRGAVVGWYPYPFIDAGALGYSRALINALILLVGFLVLGLFAVACRTEGRSLRNRDRAR